MFLPTPEFDTVYKKISNMTMVSPDRLVAIYNIAKVCRELPVPGDFLELGCCKGGISYMLASIANEDTNVFAIDTFEGLPEILPEDGNQIIGMWKVDYNDIKRFLDTAPHKVYVMEGLVEDILGQWNCVHDRKFSLIHFDLNLYGPTIFSLEKLWDRVISGGCVIFDDYLWEGTPGVRKAVDEFFGNINKFKHWVVTPQLGIIKP